VRHRCSRCRDQSIAWTGSTARVRVM